MTRIRMLYPAFRLQWRCILKSNPGQRVTPPLVPYKPSPYIPTLRKVFQPFFLLFPLATAFSHLRKQQTLLVSENGRRQVSL